jgi:phosphate starvation-inducible protein PhoH
MKGRLNKSQKKALRRQGIFPHQTLTSSGNNFRMNNVIPLTDNQERAFDAYEDGKNLLLHGLSGTGKTFISCYLALNELLGGMSDHRKMIIVRSVVPTRDIGFLPGNAKEKSKVYEAPYSTVVSDLFGRGDAYEILKTKGLIEFETTSFIRGITFEDSIIVVDEVNNMSFHELDSVITRVGRNCKIIFSGDFRQSDLRGEEKNGLHKFMNVLRKLKNFEHVEFEEEDIVRSGLVKEYIITKHKLGYDQALCA